MVGSARNECIHDRMLPSDTDLDPQMICRHVKNLIESNREVTPKNKIPTKHYCMCLSSAFG